MPLEQIKQWTNNLFRGEGHDNLNTPADEEARFVLYYNRTLVGELWLHNSVWHFRYSEDFKRQSDLKTLVDFPNQNKAYESEKLWPFFSLRIPSLEQPAVRRVIEQKHLDEHNEVEMLKHFGKKTIANPFRLSPA